MRPRIEQGYARFWDEQPILPPHLSWLHRAFWELHHFRPAASFGGLSPIPYGAMQAHARRLELSVDEQEYFFACLIEADRQYIETRERLSREK